MHLTGGGYALPVPLLILGVLLWGLIAGLCYGLPLDGLPPGIRKPFAKILAFIAACIGLSQRHRTPANAKRARNLVGICLVLLTIYLIVFLARNNWRI